MKRGDFYRNLLIDGVFFNRISASFLRPFFKNDKGATVFVYHLVCDKNFHPFLKSDNLPQLDVSLFERQLNWLLDSDFSFITIEELSNKIINGEDISSKSVVITFDDGFKITIENVLPVLESLNIKATFFVTTNWIDSERLQWQQGFYWYLANYGIKDFFDKMKEVDKETFSGVNCTRCYYKFMQDILPEQKTMLLEKYDRPIPNEKIIVSDIYPTSKDIIRLSDSGMEIGSHSCGHYFMQNLPDDLYLNEMQKSKERLEKLINAPVDSFSYPFNSYREDDDIVKKAGYKTLCTVDRRKVDKFASLKRMPRFDTPVRKILYKSSLRRLVYF